MVHILANMFHTPIAKSMDYLTLFKKFIGIENVFGIARNKSTLEKHYDFSSSHMRNFNHHCWKKNQC
jgi:hypothetical protein